MSDFGINVSTPGVNVTNATNSQLLLTTKYPFAKLDTQVATSFQTIFLYFNNDPPEPGGTGTKTTVVYSFAHGYTYTPRVWALFETIAVPSLTNFNQTYFQDLGIIATQSILDQATMYVSADATNVYIKVDKSNFGGGSANNIAASSYNITLFTFVEDISTN